ncbi:hypothetical protein EFL04_13055 [Enterococcus faecium]|nr:hypothetical protein [Enterococcus faecium]
MARPVLDAMDMDTLTKGRYVQLLARGYSPKDVFKALSKGTDMEKEAFWDGHLGESYSLYCDMDEEWSDVG